MKHLIIFILILLFQNTLNANVVEERNDMTKALKESMNNIPKEFPILSYKDLLINPQTSSSTIFDFVDLSIYDTIQKKYQFPEEVMAKFKKVIYLKSGVTYETIDYKIPQNSATINRMFGLAKKVDNQVFFIIIKSETYSQLVQKYNTFKREKCTSFLFFSSCKMVEEKRARGYTTSELDKINKGLILHNDITMKNEFDKIGTSQTMISEKNIIFSSEGKYGMILRNDGIVGIYELKEKFIRSTKKLVGQFGESKYTDYPPYTLKISNNGNIIISDRFEYNKWESKTGRGSAYLYYYYLTEDANFILLDKNNNHIFNSQDKFKDVSQLLIQDIKFYSRSGKYYAIMQSDGALCTYEVGKNGNDKLITELFPDKMITESSTPPYYFVKKKNGGNLQIVDSKMKIFFDSGSFKGYLSAYLKISERDGHLMLESIVPPDYRVFWRI